MKDFSVILLTYNEEQNLPNCLASMEQLKAPIFAVDSFSTDCTLDILEMNGIPFLQHPFENYASQRNWAQANIPYDVTWVFHLDAGERMTPELVYWLNTSFDSASEVDGYMFSRRTMFFGKWIKYGGHYPNYHLRLYRTDKGHCEHKVYDQHFIVDGNKQAIAAGIDIIDTVTDTIRNFTVSHARWAQLEATEIMSSKKTKGEVQVRFFGSPIERRRWLKNNLFQKTPIFLRSFLYFFYRYFIRLGFLDGRLGLAFHLLQGFWFRFLVDTIVLELSLKKAKDSNESTLLTIAKPDGCIQANIPDIRKDKEIAR